jgi:hypothetical protein
MGATPAPPPSERTALSKQRALKTATLAEVNQGILAAARDSIDQDQQWEFFCECGREDCHEHVLLTLDSYVALHDCGGSVLAPGHRLSQVERARRLGQDAEALMRQAAHQVKRAQKNLGRRRPLDGH